VVVAVPEGHVRELEGQALKVVAGGPSRAESVAAALVGVDSEIVVVHDAARPLVTPELVDAVVEELGEREDLAGVIAATPLTDTVKEMGEGRLIERTVDRSRLWAAQTPQAFRTEALREAHAPGDPSGATDDAMLVEQVGGRVAVHQGPRENIKVTTPLDLRLAELLLSRR
jgi:2-C-methyl-D-erythritol 4-phosphate cytidylyltransferase